MNYYFTDYEELEALRKENLKLKEERDKLLNLSAELGKECGKANKSLRDLIKVIWENTKTDENDDVTHIDFKPVLDLVCKIEKMIKEVKGDNR